MTSVASLGESGLLLLGEVHGVAENPLLIRALLAEFGLSGLALEWPDGLTPVIGAFLAGEPLAENWMLWPGDGRITAGHLAVLRERAAAGPLRLTLFDVAVQWRRSGSATPAAAFTTAGHAGSAGRAARAGRPGCPCGAAGWSWICRRPPRRWCRSGG